MTTKQQAPPQARNPLTAHRHNREVLWQIALPMLIGCLLLLLVAVFSAGMGMNETRRWADISIIWLVGFMMVGMLVSLVTLVVSIFVMQKVIQILPVQSFRLQKLFMQIQTRLGELSNHSVEPILKTKSFAASLKRLFHLHNAG
jgi:hypothetical protein